MILEWWNTTKTLSNIWQSFSCLLDEGNEKNTRNFIVTMAFLRTKIGQKCCQMGWIGCPILHVALKAIMGFQLLAYFCNLLIKLAQKILLHARKTTVKIPRNGVMLTTEQISSKVGPLLAARKPNGFNFRKPMWKIVITGSVFCISTFFHGPGCRT